MTTLQPYWIPRDLPESQQIALSIPGEAPRTLAEHRNRLFGLLLTLAEELDEQAGRGAAARAAYEATWDQAMYLEGENASPIDVVTMLMESDAIAPMMPVDMNLNSGVKDPILQARARETDFQDRLTGLTLS